MIKKAHHLSWKLVLMKGNVNGKMFREFVESKQTHTVSKKLTKASFSLKVSNLLFILLIHEIMVFWDIPNSQRLLSMMRILLMYFWDQPPNHCSWVICVMDNESSLSPNFTCQMVFYFYIKTVWLGGFPFLGYARHWRKREDAVLLLPVKLGTWTTEDDIRFQFRRPSTENEGS